MRTIGKSLLVGDVPAHTIEPAPEDVIAVRSGSNSCFEEEDDDDEVADRAAIESIKVAIQEVWNEKSGTGLDGDYDESELQSMSEKMISDTAQLQRILAARKFDTEASVNLFFEQLRFRIRMKPETIQPEEICNAISSGAWRLAGYSKDGLVVSNYKLQCWDPSKLGQSSDGTSRRKKDDVEDAVLEYTKYVVYMIESMIASMKAPPTPQKFVVLFDLKGFSPSLVFRRDVRLMIRKLIYVAQAQYPERLHKTLLVNAPLGFQSAWKLIQPLLDEKTASKIRFVSIGNLTDEIDPDVLSKEYGGNHDEYPLPC